MKALSDDEIMAAARKRAGLALAEIANNQMKTWDKYPTPDTPWDIIARQIANAIFDTLKGNIPSSDS